MSAPAKVQAMETLIEAHAVELKLPTVRARFRALAEEATRGQQTPTAYLAALLEAEVTERAQRREHRQLIDARFEPPRESWSPPPTRNCPSDARWLRLLPCGSSGQVGNRGYSD